MKKQERHVKKENHIFGLQAAGEKNPTLTIGTNCHIVDMIRYKNLYIYTQDTDLRSRKPILTVATIFK